MNYTPNAKDVKKNIEEKLSRHFGVTAKEATKEQFYKASALTVKDILVEKRNQFKDKVNEAGAKRVYYMCMEFLLGRSLKTNLCNLGLQDNYRKALKTLGADLEDLYECEPDAGLGNGGLGRLAACFMDSLASMDYPTMGFSLRYEYGLFKQKIVDGWQLELPDDWLPGGEVWLTQRMDKAFKVKFDGRIVENWTDEGMKIEHVDATEVEAIPYDMMISGKDSAAVSVLRLWTAKTNKSFDMRTFSEGDYMRCVQEANEAELLTKVLYPSDNHYEGKSLRLKQQYLLVSASLQNIISVHLERFGTLDNLPDKASIHINDTHPALCIPELMRILMDEHGYSWEKAWDIVVRTVAYTNHTVMSEALEKWSEDLIERRLPRIYAIIKEINARFCADMWNLFPGDWDKINRMSIISHGMVKMANLSVIGSKKINGVSALHSNIIKESIFKDFNDVFPERFTNVTNGIAYRRWLCQSNPELTSLISDCIGDRFIKDASLLGEFGKFENDASVLKKMNEIKLLKKKQLADYLKKHGDITLNPETLFDVQAKRLHEYKRQLLNVLQIISLYEDLKENPDLPIQPQTFIFGAKAAAGYYMAKQIIRLICYLVADIDKNPDKRIREKLKVCYIENYSVTVAEKLMPATEVSEQISQAGKEASGTGNMKFMINGALTIGTMDGANVEMWENVGDENIYIFGLKSHEVEELWQRGYNASQFYNSNPKLKRVIASLKKGYNGESFAHIADYLLTQSPVADPYMCMADFADYDKTRSAMLKDYSDRKLWAVKSLRNVAASGVFSSDRSIKEYAENIWDLKPIH